MFYQEKVNDRCKILIIYINQICLELETASNEKLFNLKDTIHYNLIKAVSKILLTIIKQLISLKKIGIL